MYAPFIEFDTEREYRIYYEFAFCKSSIITHDGIEVIFDKSQFDHAFFKSKNRRLRDKSQFDFERAKRMDWIRKGLQDNSLPLYAGYDNSKKRVDYTRRVTLVIDDIYVVIIRLLPGLKRAKFVTAWLIDDPSLIPKITRVHWKLEFAKRALTS